MPRSRRGLRLGFVEPHLECYGGIRRMIEFANRLTARGHDVTFYLPDDLPEAERRTCTWMHCDASIRSMPAGFDDELDVVLFNHEPQWYLLDRFTRARRRVFYALHYGHVYGKEGSWESIRAPVDLQLANSNWTADQIAAETGHRPTVMLGGVNRDTFHPYGGPKRFPILCTGDWREWKGTSTIIEAGRIAGVPVRGYVSKGLDQAALGREYDAAQVFAVGSWFEGFCQPGLEALACGVPLVTTDNGGCREYAIDGETALVVPPRDPEAMAAAFERMLNDEVLAKELVINGLDLVERDFDWEKRTDDFEAVLDGLVAEPSTGPSATPVPTRAAPPTDPAISVVVLAWDNLRYTQLFAESVRRYTTVPYELIVVDNGSRWAAASYAEAAADTAVLNPENLGFARGMNQGLEVAQGTWVAFCNNDTRMPEGWAERLLETAEQHPNAGIIVPAVTEARNKATVRTEAGETVDVIPPFSAPPAAVIYLMRADLVRALEGWGEEYEIASGEDVDLCFKVWVNDLDIVCDSRVLVDHVGKATAWRLKNWRRLWAQNRALFLAKWKGDGEVPRLDSCDPERFQRNRATARAVAQWMERYFKTRDRPARAAVMRVARGGMLWVRFGATARRAWPVVRRRLPPHIAHRLRIAVRRLR